MVKISLLVVFFFALVLAAVQANVTKKQELAGFSDFVLDWALRSSGVASGLTAACTPYFNKRK